MNTISAAQVRAARGILDWSMTDLSKAAGVSISTVKRFEDGKSDVMTDRTIAMIQDALESKGVCFLFDHVEGNGLRLKPASHARTP